MKLTVWSLCGLLLLLVLGVFLSALRTKRLSGKGQEDALRKNMIKHQILSRGIKNPRILSAFSDIPRHKFIPEVPPVEAYEDKALAIGNGQTISQPYIVALMTELLQPDTHSKILEIGTGSGYQAAVLSRLVDHIYTIEISGAIFEKTRRLLQELQISNVTFKNGDGSGGWPEHAPYDGIIVTAAPRKMPEWLVDQLKVGAHLVIPVGAPNEQKLFCLTRTNAGVDTREILPVRFVPLVTPS